MSAQLHQDVTAPWKRILHFWWWLTTESCILPQFTPSAMLSLYRLTYCGLIRSCLANHCFSIGFSIYTYIKIHVCVNTHFSVPTLFPEQMGENCEKDNNWLVLEKKEIKHWKTSNSRPCGERTLTAPSCVQSSVKLNGCIGQ